MQSWLEELRLEAEVKYGPIGRPVFSDPAAGDGVEAETEDVREVRELLLESVPENLESRSPEDQARVLLCKLLSWHRRESLSGWRRHYELKDMDHAELLDAGDAMSGLSPLRIVGQPKKSVEWRYKYPQQDHKMKVSERQTPLDPFRRNDKGDPLGGGTIVGLDTVNCTIDIRRGKARADQHPTALIPPKPIKDYILRECLLTLGRDLALLGFSEEHSAAWDLLLRRRPRLRSGESNDGALRRDGETSLDAAVRVVGQLDRSVLPLQGPPGSGKTHTAAHMILALLATGKTVGVTGRSHRVISNLLDKACEFDKDSVIRGIQNAPDGDQARSAVIVRGGNAEVEDAVQTGAVNLIGGTEWLFTRKPLRKEVDVLFVDEAGQVSLANVLAASLCAHNIVLIGDPQQLPQPLQGSHPPGADASVLEHILAGEELIRPDRGIFLDETYRMHPAVCGFISEQFYQGALQPNEQCLRRALASGPIVGGTGLRFLEVNHTGCRTKSHEEAEAIREAFEALIGREFSDEEGKTHSIGVDDILVVAPYNSQVAALGSILPAGAQIGTVDKFQGQEAQIVFYSMTTSSPEDIPRGMDFLFSRNRLNVAISRAQCLAVIVACPDLLRVKCRSLEQIRLANAVCAAVERGARST